MLLRLSHLKRNAFFIVFPLAYLFIPIITAFALFRRPFAWLLIFAAFSAFVGFITTRRYSSSISDTQRLGQDLQEKINVLAFENKAMNVRLVSLKEKTTRYSNLRKVLEEINAPLSLEAIAEHLTSIAFQLVAQEQGTCTLYLVDNATQSLRLCKTQKQDKESVVKAKHGDIFDQWVLRHASVLLIEDLNKDFRFDIEAVRQSESRPIGSLISTALLSGGSFQGILRLDHPQPLFYNQDDLRFLSAIADSGAVALENGRLYQDTEELAIHDGLTGLFTKGYCTELLKIEAKRSIRHNRPFSLLMMDIDYFKQYNDTFGHMAGDIVLRMISRSMTEYLREHSASVCRFGGEEFCIILSNTGKDAARQIAEGLRRSIAEKRVVLRRQETGVTVSIGLSTFGVDCHDEIELIMRADKALYEAKQKGRDRVAAA